MPLPDILKELAKLTPEEKLALGAFFNAKVETAQGVDPQILEGIKTDLRKIYPQLSEEQLTKVAGEQARKEKREPAEIKAMPVYFFRQRALFKTEKVTADKQDPDKLKKTGYFLPPRVISCDVKSASKLYWKRQKDFEYLGRSDGRAWRKARSDGLSVKEAEAIEYEQTKDMTPPPNDERTFFAGRNLHQVSRGMEIPWTDGLRQGKL